MEREVEEESGSERGEGEKYLAALNLDRGQSVFFTPKRGGETRGFL